MLAWPSLTEPGGIGFLEEYAVAHWRREALITPIWEGPSNIQALDFLGTVQRQRAHEPFLEMMEHLLRYHNTDVGRGTLDCLERTVERLQKASGRAAQCLTKDALTTLADGSQVAILYDLARMRGERYA